MRLHELKIKAEYANYMQLKDYVVFCDLEVKC